jgi:hypothetical protein
MPGKDTFKLGSAGTLTTGTNKNRWEAPFPVQILGVTAAVGTAPTGADLTLDVLLNGTSVFGSSPKPKITAGQSTSSLFNTPVLDNTVVTKAGVGDLVTLSITQVGSTVAGADLEVVVEYSDV